MLNTVLQTVANSSVNYSSENWTPLHTGVSLIAAVIIIAGAWKIFEKARQPGWAAIIPIYDVIVMLRVVRRPWWWIFLLLIPIVNLVVLIVIKYDLAKSFGKGLGYTLLLLFIPILGYPMLGFGSAKYKKRS